MNDLLFVFIGAFIGMCAQSLVSAHKLKQTVRARKGTEVFVQTTKGERKFTLALDLLETDTYAILQTSQDDSSAPVTFAVKAEKVKV